VEATRKYSSASKERKNAGLNIIHSYIPEFENVSVKKKKKLGKLLTIVVYKNISHSF